MLEHRGEATDWERASQYYDCLTLKLVRWSDLPQWYFSRYHNNSHDLRGFLTILEKKLGQSNIDIYVICLTNVSPLSYFSELSIHLQYNMLCILHNYYSVQHCRLAYTCVMRQKIVVQIIKKEGGKSSLSTNALYIHDYWSHNYYVRQVLCVRMHTLSFSVI